MADLLGKGQSIQGEVDRSPLKIGLLAGFYFILSIAFSFTAKSFIERLDVQSSLLFLITSVVFLSVFALVPILIKTPRYVYGLVFLGVIGTLAFFYKEILSQPLPFILLGAVLFFLWFRAAIAEKTEYSNSLKIKFLKIAGAFIPKAVTALIIFVLASLYIIRSGFGSFIFSEKDFDVISDWLSPAISKTFLPGFSFNLPFNQVIRAIAENQIIGDPLFSSLSGTQRTALVNEVAVGLTETVSDFLGFVIDSRLTVSKISYDWLSRGFSELSRNSQYIILAIVLLSLLLSFKLIAIPLALIIYLVSYLIYEFLLTFQFISVLNEGRNREVVMML